MCQGTFLPSSGVIVDWMSALVSLEMNMFMTWVTVASLAEESMYFVFIWALILYLPHISLRATA